MNGLMMLGDVPEWYADALCSQTDPEAFFPDPGGSVRSAKVVCAGCDVREQCLQYALDHREIWGIWGGTSERERRGMVPTTRLCECGTEIPRGKGMPLRCDPCRKKRVKAQDAAAYKRWRQKKQRRSVA